MISDWPRILGRADADIERDRLVQNGIVRCTAMLSPKPAKSKKVRA
ncbi:hypothetical protein CO731_04884 [Aminobacter sp. MSH1]|nr:hypothetical protein CO731_04884 [Aminobacter sp. MSH1]